MNYKSTKDIKVSERIVDQIIGQDGAVEIIKKAAKQRRHVLLIGDPGTGKSMVGQALAELLPKEKLVDVLSLPNPTDENVPFIKTVPRGQGKQLVTKLNIQVMSSFKNQTWLMLGLVLLVSLLPYYFWKTGQISDVIYAASMITGIMFIIGFLFFINLGRRASLFGNGRRQVQVPKLLIDNFGKKKAPFLDATGSHDGALLGDVLHDPLQCHSSVTNVFRIIPIKNQLQLKVENMSSMVNQLLKKHRSELIEQEDYRATFLNEGELTVLGEKNRFVEPVKVLSVNRHKNKHPYLIKLTTESDKEIFVTPEHKIAVEKRGKTIYQPAEKLRKGNEVITTND